MTSGSGGSGSIAGIPSSVRSGGPSAVVAEPWRVHIRRGGAFVYVVDSKRPTHYVNSTYSPPRDQVGLRVAKIFPPGSRPFVRRNLEQTSCKIPTSDRQLPLSLNRTCAGLNSQW